MMAVYEMFIAYLMMFLSVESTVAGNSTMYFMSGDAHVNGLKTYYKIHDTSDHNNIPLILLHSGDSTIETSFKKFLLSSEKSRQIVISAVLVSTLVLFIWGRWRFDLVSLGALMAVTVSGLVRPENAFDGFGDPAVVTVVAVLVISKGLLNAGMVNMISRHLLRLRGGPMVHLMALTALVTFFSAFMNNVGALTLLIPVAAWMARRGGYPPSRMLMPLAFGSLLGGMTTLIGTPPNIIISEFRAAADTEPFTMFAFFPVGAGVAVVGLCVMWALSAWVVPVRIARTDKKDLFDISEYMSEVAIPPESKVVGKTLYALTSGLHEKQNVVVIGLIRDGRTTLTVPLYEVLQAEDILLVEASSDALKELIDSAGLTLAQSKEDNGKQLSSASVTVAEAVVSFNSPLVGTTASDMNLRHRYDVNLLAMARQGQRLQRRLGRVRFDMGDILLLQGRPDTLKETIRKLGCLPLAERDLQVAKERKVLLAGGILVAGVAATTAGWAPVQVALPIVAIVLILAHILTLEEAYTAIEWPVIVLIGSMITVGRAFESSGMDALLAGQFLRIAGLADVPATLGVLLVATMLLTNVINNTAAAVLMAPIAISIAQTLGKSVDPFLMTVSIGASCAFLTPIGHQSNTLVMEPGGYRFGDFWRLGLPVSAAVVVIGIPLILRIWPP